MSLQIGNLKLGDGIPKIAVPLVGKNVDQLTIEVNRALQQHPDLIEWRIDYLANQNQLIEVGHTLRRLCQPTPLLATIRTHAEGGQFSGSDQQYEQLINAIITHHCADLVDVELQRNAGIHQNPDHPIPLLYSIHHFDKTPETSQMKNQLEEMANRGANVLKIAVMPHDASDVLCLLELTTWASHHFEQPVVTMAMGDLGKISRISGGLFGSSLTFATTQQSSAPGQLTIEETRRGIQLLAK